MPLTDCKSKRQHEKKKADIAGKVYVIVQNMFPYTTCETGSIGDFVYENTNRWKWRSMTASIGIKIDGYMVIKS